MGATGELLIKISGDIKSYEDALKKAQAKTEDLSDALKDVTKIAAVGFAALTAEVILSVHAFNESEQASRQLSQALQNQGIYSKALLEDYKRQASKLQELTGLSDESIMSAQAIVQAQLGQIKVTDQMTKAIANLSAGMHINLESAAELIAKGVDGHTMALKKNGIEIDEHLTRQERVEQIIARVNAKYRDFAEAQGKGELAMAKFKAQFSELQEKLGEKFEPLITTIINAMTSFFKVLQDPAMVNFVSGLIAAGVTFTGLITAAGSALVAFLAFKAVLIAAGTTMAAIASPALIVVGAIALLAVGIGLLVAKWDVIWPRMQAAFAGFAEFMRTALNGLAKVLYGTFNFKFDMLKEGLADLKSALSKSLTEYNSVLDGKFKEQQDAQKKHNRAMQDGNDAAAAERLRKKQEHEQAVADLEAANRELQILEEQRASEVLIEAKKAEIEQRKLLADEHFKGDRQMAADKAELLKADGDEEFAAAVLLELQKAELQRTSNDQYIKEKVKFGQAYATIAKFLRTEEIEGVKKGAGELEQLQSSSNSTLKGIGKAAALANIAIKTSESAMNIYAGFSAIPIIGQALGIAGAVAAVAFGAEQAGKVMAAADGGILTGGTPGVDSIPMLGMPGELVVPTKNFEEVVGAVADNRSSGGSSSGGVAEIILTLKGELMDFIDIQSAERDNLNLRLQKG